MLKGLGLLVVLFGLTIHLSLANDFSISSVFVKAGNKANLYKIAVEATIEMSDQQVEMLENGIPLTFSYTFVVEEKVGVLWLEKSNETKQYDFTVSYNALTQQYVVKTLWNKKYENFPTLTMALGYIAEPKNLNINIVNRKENGKYRGGVRLRLDIEALPTPLRIPAYTSKDWNLDTGWKYWEFAKW